MLSLKCGGMSVGNSYRSAYVLSNTKVSDRVFHLALSGEWQGKPGQFYMVKVAGSGIYLPRPISIADIDEDGIHFIIQRVGLGTRAMEHLRAHDSVEILGPLGNGFAEPRGRTAMIAGGIGLAPFLYYAKTHPGQTLFAGFRSGSYFLKQFEPYTDEIHIATDDGSVGEEGSILDIVDASSYDKIVLCGPKPMMDEALRRFDPKKLELSLESRMACGIGACLGCSVKTREGMLRVCHEGPVFTGDMLCWE